MGLLVPQGIATEMKTPHNGSNSETIAVAMSGGVDSSAVAALLADDDEHHIVGLTMQLWNQRRLEKNPESLPGAGRCCSLDDVYDARRVAEFLGIPYYVVNYERQFERDVVKPFVEQYLAGQTPIPCSLCNSEIKFERLISSARSFGAERVATGHYARVRRDEKTGRYRLFRAVDEAKDQTYFLFGLTQEQLARSLFPLGEMTKTQVRRLAAARRLPVARKAESQEICFIPSGDYGEFIEAYLTEQKRDAGEPGPLLLNDGKEIGRHQGIHRYTVGQRKGLGVAVGEPLYVLEINAEKNAVVVGPPEDLLRRRLLAREVNWVAPPEGKEWIDVRARIRNGHRPAPARVRALKNEEAEVEFSEPQRAVTPGQAVVFYRDEEVLGGGWISKILSD